MNKVISYLKDPQTVASFQKLCGIVRIQDKQNGGHALPANGNGSTVTANGDHTPSNGSAIQHCQNGNSSTIRNRVNGQNGHSSNHSDSQIEADCREYSITNWFLYYLFHLGANLGNEIFYITFFPFWFWNIDGYVGRRLCIFWGIFMYLGQAMKDIFKIPRPAAPPVVQLEKRYSLEYGMPSTHAMVGAGIPFGIFFLTKERYIYPSELALIGAVIWCSVVCVSRIYLGMHTILDVIVGLGFISTLMMVFFPLLDPIDDFLLHSSFSPAVCILIPLLLCIFYPPSERWNSARGDTTIIMAANTGVALGHWICYQYGYMHKASTLPPYNIIPPTVNWAGLVVLRMTIGVFVLLTLRAVVKFVSFRLACFFSGTSHKNPTAHQKLIVELPYKFVTYSVISVNMVYLAPIIFRYLGIERETFFTEI